MKNKKIREMISTLQNMVMELDEEANAESASAAPSAVLAASNAAADLHCYKAFGFPDNITVQTDILKKPTTVIFDYFNGVSSFTGLVPRHIFRQDSLLSSCGDGFSLNVCECITAANFYIDGSGNMNKIQNSYVCGMFYSTNVPAFVAQLKIASDLHVSVMSWLSNGTVARGFNVSGKLVLVCDINKNYTKISYDSDLNITQIDDGNLNLPNGKIVYSFSYNNSGKLLQIKESRSGKSVSFEYGGDNLTKMTCSNGKTLSFGYQYTSTPSPYGTVTMNVTSSDGYLHNFTLSRENVKLTSQPTLSQIPNGTESTSLPKILNWQITLGDTVKIEDIDGNCEYYKFTNDGYISDYCKEVNSLVTYAEKREYRQAEGSLVHSVSVYIAPNNLLNIKPYSTFSYSKSSDDEHTSTTYDKYNRPVLDSVYNKRIEMDGYLDRTKTSTYNDDDLLTQDSTSYTLYNIDEDEGEIDHRYYTYIVKYEYGENKRLKKRYGYYKGSETVDGMSVEEY